MKPTYALSALAICLSSALHAQSTPSGSSRALPVITAPGVSWHPETAADVRGGGPLNDDCSTLPDATLPLGGSIVFIGDNTGATSANDFEPGSPLDGVDPCVWHKFTTSGCADITVSYCATSPAFQAVLAILSPSCPTGGDYQNYFSYNYEDCGNGNGTIYYQSVPAGTWYLPVMANTFVGAVGPYSVQVSATACAVPPANDDCANAAALAAQNWCSFSYFTTAGASGSMPAVDCGPGAGFANDDVWFTFTATAGTMTIGAMGMDSSFNAVLELFSGDCGSLTSLACADDSLAGQAEQLIATTLNVGETYLLRVYDWNPGYPAPADFGICLVEGSGINLGVDERGLAQAWNVYPNPGTGSFQLQYSGRSGVGTVEVMDVTGRVVRTRSMQLVPGHPQQLDLEGLRSGNYMVRLTMGGSSSVQRLMVGN
ncbi:MAG: T9SS type A sorting domain-containing protein [Flavobacteriales bacterium]|nr:T9SS type A sorting domain-containing protein [Flavobacteriales bacterium]